jgi:hypothetical protein
MLKRAWKARVEEHCILCTRVFQGADGRRYQVVINTRVPWHAENRRDDSAFKAVPLTVALGSAITQATIFQGSRQAQAVLVLMLHHALYNGWSLPLLFEDLQPAHLG